MTIYRNSRLGCHGNKRKNKHLILKISLRPNLKETDFEKLPVALMSENKTMKYDQGLDDGGGGDVTNNTEYPHLHNHRSSQTTGILSF